MRQNVGTLDRIIRFLIAAVIAYLFFTNAITGILSTVLVAVGFVMALTALVGNCPIYTLLGIGSCEVNNQTN